MLPFSAYDFWIADNQGLRTVFSDREIRTAFVAHGFTPTGRRPQFLAPMALYRALGSAGLARAVGGTAAALGLTAALGSPVVLRLERRC